jgi:hypothetical protein
MTVMRLIAASSLAALAGTTLLSSDTKPPALQSLWASAPVVDGRAAEWTALAPFESAHLAVGVSNDDRHVSVIVTSGDQARRRQLIGAGLIVWFDTGGGKKRGFGVRFPGEFRGGRELGGSRPGQGGPPDQSGPPRAAGDGESAQAGPPEPRLPPITWFELMGPRDEDRRRLEKSAVTSIEVARDLHEGLLAFEMRIPLAKDPTTGFGIGAEAGRVLGLGLETPELERPEGPAPGRGRGGRGGMGGIGGGGGGMGGGMGRGGMGGGGMGGRPEGPGGDRPERAKPIKLWTTVKLATGAS